MVLSVFLGEPERIITTVVDPARPSAKALLFIKNWLYSFSLALPRVSPHWSSGFDLPVCYIKHKILSDVISL